MLNENNPRQQRQKLDKQNRQVHRIVTSNKEESVSSHRDCSFNH